MHASSWKAATIDVDRASEFTGDDVKKYSSLVALGENYEFLTIDVPTLDAAGTIIVYVQKDSSVATVPKSMNALVDNAVNHYIPTTTSGSGDIVVTFRIGGCQGIRIKVSGDAADDTVFYVRGFNR